MTFVHGKDGPIIDYTQWASPGRSQVTVGEGLPAGAVTYVPEVVALDVDDTLVPKTTSVKRLIDSLEASGAAIDTAELRTLCETIRGFSPYEYVYKALGDQADEALRSFRTPSPQLTFADARPLRERLAAGGVPHFALSFGTSFLWQHDKLTGPGADAAYAMGLMVVPAVIKAPFMEASHFTDGYRSFGVQTMARFTAAKAVLIDDNEAGFAGWPGKGFVLDRSGKRSSGKRINDLGSDFPEELVVIHSLDEVVVRDGQTLHRSDPRANASQTTEPINQPAHSFGVMPIRNPAAEASANATVYAIR